MNETSMGTAQQTEAGIGVQPWWRYRMLWLVFGGPLAVVVASLVTAVVAIRGADPVVVGQPGESASQRAAVQARNHAATASTRP
jgi:hypothetical protein